MYSGWIEDSRRDYKSVAFRIDSTSGYYFRSTLTLFLRPLLILGRVGWSFRRKRDRLILLNFDAPQSQARFEISSEQVISRN